MDGINFIDVLSMIEQRKISILDNGFVEIVDCMPRLVPEGRTVEYAIVRNARISYGDASLRTKPADDALVRYMIMNEHTSPIESVELQFVIKVPRCIGTQILRHRTGSYNEVSQRYTTIDNDYMRMSKLPKGHPGLSGGAVRKQSKINHQGSDNNDFDDNEKQQIDLLVNESEYLIDRLFDINHKLIELGVAKECARNILPMSTYTTIYMKMNLSNLMKFLYLRMHEHAQEEIRVCANAMYKLAQQIAPVAFDAFFEKMNSIKLNDREINFMRDHDMDLLGCIDDIDTYSKSVSERHAFTQKLLHIKYDGTEQR